MRPRRAQTPVSIRSDKVAERLKLLARNGRSQAEVLEDAIDRIPADEEEIAARIARIRELSERFAARKPRFASVEDFDRWAYDERGLPR